MLKKTGVLFMCIAASLSILSAGCGRSSGDRIFLDRYYTEEENVRQTYDLAIPKNVSGSAGLVLCIHGGGWVGGSKKEYTQSILQMSAEKGVAAACMNYRYVSETVGFDDELDDISSALAAIKAEGATYGVDFDRVLLSGVSAGGHLSLLYANTRADSAPVKPVCVVELCGPTDFEDDYYYSEENSITKAVGADYFRNIISNGIRYTISPDDLDAAGPALRQYSPIRFISENSVPTVFGHGEQDEIVPYQNALDLDARLTACGVEHTFVSFPDSSHGCEDKASMTKIMELFFDCAEKYLK